MPDSGNSMADGRGSTAGTIFGAAADRLREAARWLVITFGAVAAVVFVGISVSRFGDLELEANRAEFWYAIGGALLAIGGTLAALLTAMSLAAASTITVNDLLGVRRSWQLGLNAAKDAVARDPALAPWDQDIRKLVAGLEGVSCDFHGQLDSWRKDTSTDANPELVNRASTVQNAHQQVLTALVDTASYMRLQKRFRIACWILGVALLLAAAGAVLFVWATGSEATEDIPTEVVLVDWRVPADRWDEIEAALGNGCPYPAYAVPAMVLGTDDDGQRDIATIPTEACSSLRLVVDGDDLVRQPGE